MSTEDLVFVASRPRIGPVHEGHEAFAVLRLVELVSGSGDCRG